MSTAFAAELSTLDGDMVPPKRFLELLAAVTGRPVPPTTCVFDLTRSSGFPVLQQLYNVTHVVSVASGTGSIQALPETAGPAWFPSRVETVETADDVARAIAAHRDDLRSTIGGTAWLLRRDLVRLPGECTGATVRGVTTDVYGQTATIAVDARAECALVVATNYVSTLRANATVGGTTRDVPVFPIDIALVGIAVPAGATTIVLGPEPYVPWWTRVGSIVGLVLLVGAVVLARQRSS
jgi:hypothetical protein